mgnify:CR=1 FL=1
MTKIFCDIADIYFIKKFNKKKIVKGFTTNPSLMRKAGAKNYTKYCKSILKITKKPVSFEVFADDKQNIIKQALKIKDWGNQVYVKIPVTNSKGLFLDKEINKLNKENIKLNITAVYTSKQTSRILKNINKKTKVIISIFAGRMADKGKDPVPEIKKSIILAKKFNSAVFPGLQGGPLMHVIAAKAVAFGEALRPDFKKYQQQVISNAKCLGRTLTSGGLELVTQGTDTHLLLVDLRPKNVFGRKTIQPNSCQLSGQHCFMKR